MVKRFMILTQFAEQIAGRSDVDEVDKDTLSEA